MLSRTDRPSAEDVLGVVRAAVATVLEVDPAGIDRATAFGDLKADSLALVELAEIVEERLAPFAPAPFRIPDADLEALVTVGEAVDYALARL
ncbi:MAG: acyl carrier protein [Frankiaceae bacterium]|nr:acyl carrier protein [Frankiaceae bacterium]